MTGPVPVTTAARVETGSRRGPDGWADDTGGATVFVCLAVGLLLVFAGAGVHVAAAVLARHRAEAAADLGALAGATAVLTGTACERATDLVRANGADLVSCVQDGADVRVQVEVDVPFVGLGASAQGRARAGPAAP